MNINVSAYLSSIRPYRWMAIHEMLAKTGLSFELVVVGPNEPDYELPKEIKFYKSDVKPTQCFHAAASMSSGETLLQIVDDIEYGDGAIKSMYETVMNNDNANASCNYFQDGTNQIYTQNIAGQHLNLTYLPLLPVCGLYRRSVYAEIGGLDKRFNGAMGELDLYMRMKMNGYSTVFVNNYCNENTSYQKKEKTSLCGKYWNQDRPTFIKLWSTQGVLFPIRNDIVRKFSDENLLTVDQNYGPVYHVEQNGKTYDDSGRDVTTFVTHNLLCV